MPPLDSLLDMSAIKASYMVSLKENLSTLEGLVKSNSAVLNPGSLKNCAVLPMFTPAMPQLSALAPLARLHARWTSV